MSRASIPLLHFSSVDGSQITLPLPWGVITSPLPLFYLQCQGKVILISPFFPRYNPADTGQLLCLIPAVYLCFHSSSHGLTRFHRIRAWIFT